MRCPGLRLLGLTALLGLLGHAGGAHAQVPGCTTCGPAPYVAHGLHNLHAKLEVKRGCASCNPNDPYSCGSTGMNGQNGYCNQRLQAVRRIGVLMNHNEFMGDSWLYRYHGGYNFSPPSPYLQNQPGARSGY